MKDPFQREGKEKVGDHVKKQMSEICVNHAAGNDGIKPLFPGKAVRMQHQLMVQVLINKQSVKTGDQCEYKDDGGNGSRPEYFLHGSQISFTRRSEEHTSELQSLMRISYAVFCLKKK